MQPAFRPRNEVERPCRAEIEEGSSGASEQAARVCVQITALDWKAPDCLGRTTGEDICFYELEARDQGKMNLSSSRLSLSCNGQWSARASWGRRRVGDE